MAQTCIIKSVTLTEGEQFVLPPGGRLIGASDTDVITSSCGALNDLESTNCYGFIMVATEGQQGDETEVLEQTQITYYGVRLNGVEYEFVDQIAFSSGTELLWNQIDALNIGLIDASGGFSNDATRDSYKNYLVFRTIPSVANNLELLAQTSSPNAGAGIPQVKFRIACILQSVMVSDGNETVPECGVGF